MPIRVPSGRASPSGRHAGPPNETRDAATSAAYVPGILVPIERPAYTSTTVLPDPARRRSQHQSPASTRSSTLVSSLARLTVLGPRAKATRVVEALGKAGFLERRAYSGSLNLQTLYKFYGHSLSRSNLLNSADFRLQDSCAWLTNREVEGLRRLFIDRAYVEIADGEMISETIPQTVERFFRQEKLDRDAHEDVYLPVPAPGLIAWHHAHCDPVFFDPASPVVKRPWGPNIYAGITPSHHPVIIKVLLHCQENPTEARHGRRLSLHGPLASSVGHEAPPYWRQLLDFPQLFAEERKDPAVANWLTLLLLPLAAGSLDDLAPHFLALQVPSPQPQLSGARYLLHALLEELAFLHEEQRFVHQDIKPGNIFVQRRLKRPILADFGMTTALEKSGVTKVAGYTRQFASPEQLIPGQDLDAKSDVFSLAASLIEMIMEASPEFSAVYRRLFPHQKSVPHTLFDKEKRYQAAVGEWHLWQPVPPDSVLRHPANRTPVHRRFDRIFDTLTAIDPGLERVLRPALAFYSQHRRSAKVMAIEARSWCPVDSATRNAAEALYDELPLAHLEIIEEVEKLKMQEREWSPSQAWCFARAPAAASPRR